MAIEHEQRIPRPNSFRREDPDELQDFFDTASIGMHWVGADGTILRANAADYEPLGYTAAEYIGHNIAEFHVDAAVIRDILERLGNNERLYNCRARLLCKDGSIKHVLIDSSVLWRNGEFIHTRCFTRDDTGRVAAEEESRAQAHRIATITDALPVLISYVDADLRYRFNNRAYEEWFGHKREELEGKTLREVLGEEAVEAVAPHIQRVLAGESLTFEAMIPYRDIGPRWVRVSYEPDKDQSGVVHGFYAIIADISEKQAAIERLSESEARYRTLAEALPSYVASFDSQGHAHYVNERWLTLTGRSMQEMLGPRWTEAIHPDDLSLIINELSAASNEGRLASFEYRARAADGSYRWLLGSVAGVVVADGAPTTWIGASTDITDRKQAEAALSYELGLNDTITQNASVALIMLNRDGRVTFANPAAELLSGYGEDELLGQLMHQKSHSRRPDGSAYPFNECPIMRANSEGVPLVEHEDVFVRPDGTFYHVLCNALPLDNEGHRGGMLLEIRDITEEKRREARDRFLEGATEAMNSSLEYDAMLTKLAELAVPHVADIGAVGVLTGGSHTARFSTALADPKQAETVANVHLRNWTVDDGNGRTVAEVMDAGETLLVGDAPSWIATHAPSVQQRELAQSLDSRSLLLAPLMVRGVTVGMMTFAVTARSGRRYGEADKVLMAELGRRAGLALDNARLFGDLRTTAENLQRANAAKDEFLGLVSHELKTPITTIYGNAAVLQRAGAGLSEDQRSNAVADIRHESERLVRIIDNLLVLARMEQSQKLETEPMLAGRTVSRVVEDHRRRFPERPIQISDRAGITPAAGVPEAVEQILRNLLSNAEKYSPRDTTIELALTIEDGMVVVRVLDRGQGIDEDEREEVFTPFYRSSRTSAAAPGAGIGLAVCKRLIEAQDGIIWARRREGGGSEFGFALPAVSEEEFEAD